MKYLLALLFSLMTACRPAADPSRGLSYTNHQRPDANILHIPVWIDPRLSVGLRISVLGALAEWNTALNGYLRYELATDTYDGHSDGMRLYFEYSATAELADATTLGWVVSDDKNVVHLLGDGRNVTPGEMRVVAMHEIGHTLGVSHLDGTGLMSPSYQTQTGCIDHATVQAVAAVHEWDDRRMNYCE